MATPTSELFRKIKWRRGGWQISAPPSSGLFGTIRYGRRGGWQKSAPPSSRLLRTIGTLRRGG